MSLLLTGKLSRHEPLAPGQASAFCLHFLYNCPVLSICKTRQKRTRELSGFKDKELR